MTQSAEIICVGSELLLGDILNGNAQYLAQQLASLGIAHHYQTVVGDNPLRIQRATAIACERARLIIFTGGLGPTPDDLTLAALADFFDVPLVEQPDVITDLDAKFARYGRSLTDSARKQAQLPEGAAILPNPVGTAPGVIWVPRPGLMLMTFPGVPWEMKAMWTQTAVPHLKAKKWAKGVIHSQTLKFWGMGESTLAEKIPDLLASTNPTVAPYALSGEVKLRLSARADTIDDAKALIEPIATEIRQRTGSACYGQDADTLASVVGQKLSARGESLSVAESCTGGGLGRLITAVSGSSTYFMGGVISYDNRIKASLLRVREETLSQQGAVSAAVAAEMAEGVRDRLNTSWGLSITGIAGPGGGSAEKPVGLVYVGLANASETTTERYLFSVDADRERIRQRSAQSALNLLRLQMQR